MNIAAHLAAQAAAGEIMVTQAVVTDTVASKPTCKRGTSR